MNATTVSWMEAEEAVQSSGAFARRVWWRTGLYIAWRAILGKPSTHNDVDYGFMLMDGDRIMGQWTAMGDDKGGVDWVILDVQGQNFLKGRD